VISIRYKAIATLIALICTIYIGACSEAQPKFEGTLLFHNYSSYDSWDGQLYLVDLKSKKMSNLTAGWQDLKHTINGSISADGKFLTFMGSQSDIEDWDVFVSHWNGHSWEQPINFTGPNGKRDEDPKFSPTENRIIYKEDGIVATVDFDKRPKYFVAGSMPYFLPNGRDFIFERDGAIVLYSSGKEIEMFAGEGLKSYYPITLNEKEFLYTRVQSSRHDAIMLGTYDGKPSKSLFFNNDQWDNSDPFPYQDGKSYLFLVSGDYLVPKGGYNLVVADLEASKIIDADSLFGALNTDLEELGPYWSPHSFS
jgi:Tol biopolymer transport system component